MLTLTPDCGSYPKDGEAVAIVRIEVRDDQGTLCAGPDEIRVQLLGDGELLGLENGRCDDLTPYAAPYRQTLDGTLIAYVRLGKGAGDVQVHATLLSGLTGMCILHAMA